MENLPDYYAILQVHPRAEKEVIDAAYRKLAVRYHPDVSHSPNTADRMKQINAAYEVLSDPVKRAEYDSKRGMGPSSETANNGNSSPRSLNQAWRRFVIPVGVVVLGALAKYAVKVCSKKAVIDIIPIARQTPPSNEIPARLWERT